MNIFYTKPFPLKFCQSGLTLVELMVALFISLAVVGGIITFASSNKTSYTMQNELGRLQENARFALDTLARNIGSAGFRTTMPIPPDVGIIAFDPFDPLVPLPIENIDPHTDPLMGMTVASGRASDRITTTSESVTGSTQDCLGQNVLPADAGVKITNTYFIGDQDNDGQFDLYCLGSGSVASQVLVEAVDNMQILYGEDMDNDDIADLYVNANNVTNWQRIMSVRIALLMSSLTPLRTGEMETETYRLLNTRTMGPFALGENRIRRVFTRTILIRTNLD
ncbi:MAG: PilW family protein [Gammaproteobacteria bacterium]|nr:PilW family protein [Gammaproteobacteria bacterium]